jgi:TetR/AcrR family transcriptional regulator, transcriptional repressor for nem operon
VKSEDTKTKILDVAQDLIQRLGVNAMSYHDISEAVGIRKASIHHHFPSKDNLLKELLIRYSRQFDQVVDQIFKADLSPNTKIRRYMELFENTLEEGNHDKVCLCGILGAELTTIGSPSARLVKKFYEENEAKLVVILKQGLEQGIFDFPGDPKAMAKIIFSFLEGGLFIVRAQGDLKQFRSMMNQCLKLLGAV